MWEPSALQQTMSTSDVWKADVSIVTLDLSSPGEKASLDSSRTLAHSRAPWSHLLALLRGTCPTCKKNQGHRDGNAFYLAKSWPKLAFQCPAACSTLQQFTMSQGRSSSCRANAPEIEEREWVSSCLFC